VGASGWVFDIRRYSVHDGPGIRTTVFLKGCGLRCDWCHNPESQARRPGLLARPERCVHCGACVDACPAGAIAWRDDVVTTDAGRCLACGACAEVCPAEARAIVGRRVSADEVVREVERDRTFFDESGGGATVSGGEPLLQPAFLRALLVGCRERGIRTALDTSGHGPGATVLAMAALADLVLFDLKHLDTAAHRAATGVGNGLILANLRRLAAAGTPLTVRIPLVPGFSDTAANLGRTADFLATLDPVPPVQLLPFHTAAAEKHRRFGMPYRRHGARTQSPAELEACRSWFVRAGIDVEMGA
jgi:pyruvate formate lyase activating enzyme